MLPEPVRQVFEPILILVDIVQGNIGVLAGLGLFLVWIGKAALVTVVLFAAVYGLAGVLGNVPATP